MIHRSVRLGALALLSCLLFGAGAAEAQYRYGGGGGFGDQGFFVFVDAALANPRNSDGIVATSESIQDFGGGTNVLTPILPDWDNEFAGRIGGGYEWGSGSKVSASVWVLEAQQAASGNGPTGGSVHFAIGPPILTGGSFVGNEGSPGFYDVTTEIKATTFDVAWARTHDLSDDFSMEWSVGLRYAEFEETMVGVYDEDSSTGANFLQVRYDAAKSNQGEFIGARAGVRATHRALTRLSLTAGLGFSFLDGEYTASSSLTPSGVVNSLTVPGSLVSIVDDGRSGSIRDFDAAAIWHAVGDALQVSFGWERSSWEDVAADLVRNFPGTTSPLRERRSVSFSAYKVGVLFRL